MKRGEKITSKQGKVFGAEIFYFSLAFLLILVVLVSAENLNFPINGFINGYDTDFRVRTNTLANIGYDAYDLVSSPPPSNYSEFYSRIAGNSLIIDTWNMTVMPRTFNLTYYLTEMHNGSINFSWTLMTGNYTGNFSYYADDNTYTTAKFQVNTRQNGSLNYTVTNNQTIYVRLVVDFANYSPNAPVPKLNSTDVTSNRTLDNLTCYATITDPDSGLINVTIEWYKNRKFNFSMNYNNSYVSGTFFMTHLHHVNTTKWDNWTCGMRLNKYASFTNWVNTSQLQINNSLPHNVTLLSPAANEITTNRTLRFNWTGVDDDGDTLTYDINLSCWTAAKSYVSVGKHEAANIPTANYTPYAHLRCLIDNNNYYNWSVRANDGDGYGNWTTPRNLSIQSVVSITLPTNSVLFGDHIPGEVNDTTDDKPLPLVLRNDGNAELNISVNFTDLWTLQLNPSAYYQFKIRAPVGACAYAADTSSTIFVNAPDDAVAATRAINRLNFTNGYQTGCNNVSIEINVSVPAQEPSGNKSSWVAFTASLGEPSLT